MRMGAERLPGGVGAAAIGRAEAAAHLQRRGLRILVCGARTPRGEIDLIAVDPAGGTVVFVDVRTGPAPDQGWLRPRRRALLRRLALEWLSGEDAGRPAAPLRFDAISVVLSDDGALMRLDHAEGPW